MKSEEPIQLGNRVAVDFAQIRSERFVTVNGAPFGLPIQRLSVDVDSKHGFLPHLRMDAVVWSVRRNPPSTVVVDGYFIPAIFEPEFQAWLNARKRAPKKAKK